MNAVQAEAVAFVLAISLAPLVAGRLAAALGGGRRHLALLLLFMLLGAAAGAWGFAQRDPAVPFAHALAGAALVGGAIVLVPMLAYFELGYHVRSKVALAAVWTSSLVLLAMYLVIAALYADSELTCVPQTDCSLFG